MLHMMKVAVGIRDLAHLEEINQKFALLNGGYPFVLTRFLPKQAEEILQSGGSLYRVINGTLCCRQVIHEFTPTTRENGSPCIQISMQPEIIRTYSIPVRPFQGWRYLKPEDAPKDLPLHGTTLSTPLPTKMRRELEELGLIDPL